MRTYQQTAVSAGYLIRVAGNVGTLNVCHGIPNLGNDNGELRSN